MTGTTRKGNPRIMALLIGCALLGQFWNAAPAATFATPDAVVTDIEGSVRLERGPIRRPVAALDPLFASDRLSLAPGARVETAITNGAGRVVVVRGPCHCVLRGADIVPLDGACALEQRDLAQAWRALRIAPGALGRASVSMRGAARAPMLLLAPVGPQLANAPTRLRWEAPYGPQAQAWEYAVRLIDPEGQLILSARTREPSFSLAGQPLLPGLAYLWTVEATAPDGRRSRAAAEFLILGEAAQRPLRALQAAAMQLRVEPQRVVDSAEEVLLAVALEQAGLRNDAQAQWQAIGALRPAIAAAGATRP